MTLLLLRRETHLDEFGRHSAYDGVWVAALRNDGTGGYDAAFPYGDTLEYGDVGSYPATVFYYDGLVVLWQFLVVANVNDMLSNDVDTMVSGYDCRLRSKENFVSYCARRSRTVDGGAFGDRCAIADGQIFQSLKVTGHWPQIHAPTTVLHTPFIYRCP